MLTLLNRQNIRNLARLARRPIALALLALSIGASLLTAATLNSGSQAAASYPFPGRAEDLPPGHYWYFSNVHAGGSKALDLVGVRFDNNLDKWTRYRGNTPDADTEENSDSIIYNTPVHAIADGEVIACWRNAPENPRPGESHAGRLSTPKTISRSANFLVVKSANENKTVLYAHLKTGTVPPGLCPFNAQFMQNADDKDGGDYPVEAIVPAGQRAQIKQGQVIGRVGNAGASSGPHLHIDMSDVTGENEEGPSLPIKFHGAWTKSILATQDVTTDWERLSAEELTTPKTAILPDYSKGFPEIARHGVAAADYQFAVEHISKSGYRLVWVDGFEVNGKNFFNAIFRPADGTQWTARHNLTADQYQDEFDLRQGQGFRPLQVESYTDGNAIRYAVIFVKQAGPAWTAYHGRTDAQHQALFNNLNAAGYRIVNSSVVFVGGQRSHTAFYEQKFVGSYEARPVLTSAEYQAKFNENKAAGRQLVYLNAYDQAGSVRFTAIWQSAVAGAYVARHDLTRAEYQDEWELRLGQGYLTRLVTGYDAGASANYAALWRK